MQMLLYNACFECTGIHFTGVLELHYHCIGTLCQAQKKNRRSALRFFSQIDCHVGVLSRAFFSGKAPIKWRIRRIRQDRTSCCMGRSRTADTILPESSYSESLLDGWSIEILLSAYITINRNVYDEIVIFNPKYVNKIDVFGIKIPILSMHACKRETVQV